MRKTGLFGGTFNPIHNAHVLLAVRSFEAAKLDDMLIIPTYLTNLKDNSILIESEDRINMCRLAFSDMMYYHVSDMEIRRGRMSYTSETLFELNKKNDDVLYHIIMGADSYINLFKWKDYEYILENSVIIVSPRDGISYDDLKEFSKRYKGYDPVIMKKPVMALSSTLIRERISKGC